MARARAARPRIPDRPEYGAGEGRTVGWGTARRWLERSRYYWLVTTRADGRPHAVPVWAVWLDDRLSFATSPDSSTARNLRRRADVVAHPESAARTVIVHGRVGEPRRDSLDAVVAAYEAKYGWRLDPADEGMPLFELTPRRVLAWRAEDIRGTAARWDF